MKILVTGGCGFVGSNFIRYILADSEVRENHLVINLDKQVYVGNGRNLEHMGLARNPRLMNIVGDVCNRGLVERVYKQERPEIVFNFAAECHADLSIEYSERMIMSNVVGAANLLDLAKKYGVKRFVQVSTAAVYGNRRDGYSSEGDKLRPSNFYSASKASADLIALTHFKVNGLPVIIARSANNYGKYQSLENFIASSITNLIDGKKIQLMLASENSGFNLRDWINVRDNCRAIWLTSQNGADGEIYNIPGDDEQTNLAMARILLKEFNLGEEWIEEIANKNGPCLRDSTDGWKLKRLGFEYVHKNLGIGLAQTIKWYKENENWWRPLKDVCPSIEDNPSSEKQQQKIAINSHRREDLLVRKGFIDLL